MKRIRFYSLILIAVISLSTSVFAQKTESDIRTMLEERDVEIKKLLGPEGSDYTDAQREELKEIINGVIDFTAMSRQALEGTYDTLSEASRTEFVDLFSNIVSDNSLKKLDIYRATVRYNTISIEGDEATVETMVYLDDVRTPVDYKMSFEDGEWVIVDMSIDDVSTVDTYYGQFSRIIKRRGFDSLMESLRKRAARDK